MTSAGHLVFKDIMKDLSDFFVFVYFIDLIIWGEDVCHAKPHPEGILTAIRRLEIEPSSLLYVGDSTIDARAAQAAGVDFAGVLTGTTSCEELKAYPHVRIMHSLNELLSL